jgi:hypothetical protein
MADKKISALTAATTPLDGTEILPIVQAGATVKVANNDLRPKQIQANATSGVLQITGPAGSSTRIATVPDANFTVARTDAAQSFTGDQTLSTGNLIMGTSGKGIDFSATPGTGTSELFADYEEGTWTPTWGGTTTNPTCTYTTQTGKYTKIGNRVFCFCEIATATTAGGSGNLRILGLPFAVGSGMTLKADYAVTFTSNFPSGGVGAASLINLTGTISAAEQSYLSLANLQGTSYLQATFSYFV